jgi:hypothetical protein
MINRILRLSPSAVNPLADASNIRGKLFGFVAWRLYSSVANVKVPTHVFVRDIPRWTHRDWVSRDGFSLNKFE